MNLLNDFNFEKEMNEVEENESDMLPLLYEQKRQRKEEMKKINEEISKEEIQINKKAIFFIFPGIFVPFLLCWVWIWYIKNPQTSMLKGTKKLLILLSIVVTFFHLTLFTIFITCIVVFA